MPDADIERDGQRTHLQEALSPTAFTLLLCGRFDDLQGTAITKLADKYAGLLEIRHLSRERHAGALVDGGDALARLGLRANDDAAQYLVRPDGYIAFRCAGCDLGAVDHLIAAWKP